MSVLPFRHQLAQFVHSKVENFESSYKRLDSNFQNFAEGLAPQVLGSQDRHCRRVFYSLHGFLGSPEEMKALDAFLISQGFAIFHDLLPGFGATPEICENFSAADWLESCEESLHFLLANFEEVVVCGFSTGALVIHQVLLKNSQNPRLKKVKGFISYSPFYRETLSFGQGLLGPISKWFHFFSVAWMYRLSGIQDLQVLLMKPDQYLQRVPLRSAFEVKKLGQQVLKSSPVPSTSERRSDLGNSPTGKLSVPVMLFLSKVDKVAEPKTSLRIVERDFQHVTKYLFTSSQIPHHVMVSEVNPEIELLRSCAFQFLSTRMKNN